MQGNRRNYKTDIIYKWKKRGLLYHDIDELYEIYINTMNCSHCGKEFKTTRERHLDHDHETGSFRAIVCNGCNTKDNYIRFPDGVPSLKERHKLSMDKNKHKYIKKNKERSTQKNNCACGGKYTRGNKSTHEKTEKHSYWLMEQVD